MYTYMYVCVYMYIYICICICIYIYIYIYITWVFTEGPHIPYLSKFIRTGRCLRQCVDTGMRTDADPHGQFSKFHVCCCGLDSGNLKFETVRANKQHICF